jgi:hypothetical protein
VSGARLAEAFVDAERVAVSPLDERFRDGYWAGLQADDYSALVAQLGDSSEGGTAQRCLVEMDGYSAVPQAGGSSLAAELDGSFPADCSRDDCSAVAASGDSVAWLVDGSTLPARQGADLEPAEWSGDSLVGWRVGWRAGWRAAGRAVQVAPRLAGWRDGRWSALRVCLEAPA